MNVGSRHENAVVGRPAVAEAPTHDGRPNSGPPAQARTIRPELSELPDPYASAELAAAVGKSPKTIVDWCQEREYTHVPCFRLGNRWYHRVPELRKWLNGIRSGHLEFRRKPRSSAKKRR